MSRGVEAVDIETIYLGLFGKVLREIITPHSPPLLLSCDGVFQITCLTSRDIMIFVWHT